MNACRERLNVILGRDSRIHTSLHWMARSGRAMTKVGVILGLNPRIHAFVDSPVEPGNDRPVRVHMTQSGDLKVSSSGLTRGSRVQHAWMPDQVGHDHPWGLV